MSDDKTVFLFCFVTNDVLVYCQETGSFFVNGICYYAVEFGYLV